MLDVISFVATQLRSSRNPVVEVRTDFSSAFTSLEVYNHWRGQNTFLMNDTTYNNPTSCLMTTSRTSPAIQKLQRIKDLVVQGATTFSEIKSPEVAYNESVASKKGQIDECFRCLRELREPGDGISIEAEIVRLAGELQILQDRGRADAEVTYENQIESVLQRLSDELIPTIGPAVIKKSLQNIAVEIRQQYLPDEVRILDQAAATAWEFAPASEDVSGSHGVRSLLLT